MKSVFAAFFDLFLVNAGIGQSKNPSYVYKFGSEIVDLVKPKVGNHVNTRFTFTNKSKENIVIDNVSQDYGGIKSNYTKQKQFFFKKIFTHSKISCNYVYKNEI